tara:strand:- start:3692 stop:4825 length:1134 start_codon:yes stop_codon:yes gene_type:complete
VLKLVWLQFRLDPARTLFTATAVAAVVAVILVLEGFDQGLLRQLRDAVLQRRADLIVTQAGVSNMIAARSILPQFARAEVEAVPGVAGAHPLTGIPLIYGSHDRRTPIFLWVYQTAGGPQRLHAGHPPTAPREIVVDRSLAVKHTLGVGDPLVISDFEFRISGIADDAAAFFTPFAFARYDDLIDFYFESDVAADLSSFPLLSFLLVELNDGVAADAVAGRIEAAVPAGDVHLPADLAALDVALGRTLFGPILRLLVAVAYVIGALVLAIILFAAVSARQREHGVLKALGFSTRFLGGAVVVEALLLTALALPVGIVLALGLSRAIEVLAPLYVILPLEPVPLLRTVVACLAFSVLGAVLPVRLIAHVDPSRVFGGT